MKKIIKQILVITFVLIQNSILFGQTTILKTINFRSDQYQISNSETHKIKEIVELISSPDFSYLKIFGFASQDGDKDYNEILSKKRANEVYLAISKISKIDESKFYIEWLGESDEVYDLHYENSNHQKKCVDVLIMLEKE